MTHKTTIYNDVTIDDIRLAELHNSSSLEEKEIVYRLKQIYTQTNKGIDEIIEKFIENKYDTLNTIKSFYTSKILKRENGLASVNQLRMYQIRKYMDEREKIKNQ